MAKKKSSAVVAPPLTWLDWGIHNHGGVLVESTNFPTNYIKEGATVVFDVENDSDGTVAGIGIADAEGDGPIYFFDKSTCTGWAPNVFSTYKLIAHNAKYDVQMMRRWGFNVSLDQIVWDTQIVEYVRDSSQRTGLKAIAHARYGARYPEFNTLCKSGRTHVEPSTLPPVDLANYNGCDVFFTRKLYQEQCSALTEAERSYFNSIELPTLRIITEMEERGVMIDADYLRNLDLRFSAEREQLVTRLRNVSSESLNPNSFQQIKQLILDKTRVKLTSTDAEHLERFGHLPLVKDILRYRTVTKLSGTYTGPLIQRAAGAATYRLHPRFNQTNTITGRLSSSDPNVQNIPVRSVEASEIRKAFVAKSEHRLLVVDYSQIQPSLMAHYSQDPRMLEIFRTEQKIYKLVIDICGLSKRLPDQAEAKAVAKILWLALAFNAGPGQLSKQTGLSYSECERFIKTMEQELPDFFTWKNETIAQTHRDGYVTTLMGRRIPVAPEWAHLGPNYIIQGGESEIVKLSMQPTLPYNPVMMIHDELVFEVGYNRIKEVSAAINSAMSEVVQLTVPLRVEIGVGKSWLEAKH